jgi:hypothetical protein
VEDGWAVDVVSTSDGGGISWWLRRAVIRVSGDQKSDFGGGDRRSARKSMKFNLQNPATHHPQS